MHFEKREEIWLSWFFSNEGTETAGTGHQGATSMIILLNDDDDVDDDDDYDDDVDDDDDDDDDDNNNIKVRLLRLQRDK